MRLVLGIEYDGSRFSGWQSQIGERTVQGVLEQAISEVADHPVALVCAGRTDAGVHAVEQIAHFETSAERPERAWTLGVNSNLPGDVSISWVRPAPPDFHARFSARSRSYRYWIMNSPLRPALLRHRAWWVRRSLDAMSMNQAAGLLMGAHDFSAFRAAECQAKSALRTVSHIGVIREGQLLRLDITANAFLHHMVRNIAGTLVVVGRGDAAPEWVEQVLRGADRRAAGPTAAACGLYLRRVMYPDFPGRPANLHDPVAMSATDDTA
ncbi:MAG: tRNA pseudouridine(38-40) synthase TruA [Gammaproteobacteria bacterium]